MIMLINWQVKGTVVKRMRINNHVSNLNFRNIEEDVIKNMLSRKLAQEIAENFFKDLELKKNNNDNISTIEYYYNFFILETKEYRAITGKLKKVIDNFRTKDELKKYTYELSLLHNIMHDLTLK